MGDRAASRGVEPEGRGVAIRYATVDDAEFLSRGNRHPNPPPRRLTPVECERLQGFPDGWTDGQSDSTRYRQLGNAVAVPVIEWLGQRIMAAA